MSVVRMLTLSLSLAGSVLGFSQARADLPELDEGLINGPCATARAQDECPSCTCQFITSTSSINADATSNIPIGLVMKLEGKRQGDVDYAAIHVVLGDKTKLAHIGRLAESFYTKDSEDTESFRQFEVTAMTQEYQMCPGLCDWNPVGLIHPFEVKMSHSATNITAFEETRTETTMVVMCFELSQRPVCYGVPVAAEVKQQTVPGSPFDKVKVKSRDGFKRSWKLGAKDELKLGAASGKLAKILKDPKAVAVPLRDLPNFPDAEQVR